MLKRYLLASVARQPDDPPGQTPPAQTQTPPAQTPPAQTQTPPSGETTPKPDGQQPAGADQSKSLADPDAGKDPPKDGDKPKDGEGDKDDKSLADPDGKTPVVKDIDGNPIPDAYELKAPDGFVLDEALNTKAQAWFKEQRFSPAQAQAAAEFFAEYQRETWQKFAATTNEWATKARNDEVMGGANFDKNLGIVRSAVAQYGDNELRDLFNSYGVGNHPAMLRFIFKMGRATGEAGAPPPSDGNPGGADDSPAKVLYGKK